MCDSSNYWTGVSNDWYGTESSQLKKEFYIVEDVKRKWPSLWSKLATVKKEKKIIKYIPAHVNTIPKDWTERRKKNKKKRNVKKRERKGKRENSFYFRQWTKTVSFDCHITYTAYIFLRRHVAYIVLLHTLNLIKLYSGGCHYWLFLLIHVFDPVREPTTNRVETLAISCSRFEYQVIVYNFEMVH